MKINKPKKSGLKVTIITTVSIVVIAVVLRCGLMVAAAHMLDLLVSELENAELALHSMLGVSRVDMIKDVYLIATGDDEGLVDGLLSYLPTDLIDSLVESGTQNEVESSL